MLTAAEFRLKAAEFMVLADAATSYDDLLGAEGMARQLLRLAEAAEAHDGRWVELLREVARVKRRLGGR
jgi:hypothetical protein